MQYSNGDDAKLIPQEEGSYDQEPEFPPYGAKGLQIMNYSSRARDERMP